VVCFQDDGPYFRQYAAFVKIEMWQIHRRRDLILVGVGDL
jgi:hypothetical protein